MKNNNKWTISIFSIIFIILVLYISWIWIIFYNKFLEIDEMYTDSYNKRLNIDEDIWKIVRIKKIEQEKNNLINLEIDYSIQKFVTSSRSFNDKSYVPEKLVSISSDFIYDTKWWRQLLRDIANKNLQNLAEEFKKEFSVKLSVVSAYRSYKYQQWIKSRWCPDNLCAKAGFSEHQSGLAVDLFEASSNYSWKINPKLVKYYKWLDDNAHKYGFHNTYQKWLNTDWYEIEPWHWRYLWDYLAKKLKEENITIAEFYKEK